MALNQCKECNKEYQGNLSQCPHCGYINTTSQQVEVPSTNDGNPSPFLVTPQSITPFRERRKLNKRLFIAPLLLILIITIVSYANYLKINEYLLTQLAAQRKQDQIINEKMDAILLTLSNQTRYWTINVTETDSWIVQGTQDEDIKEICVVVGLSFTKNVDSPFYLDDSYDDGLFSFYTVLLKLNTTEFSHQSISGCSHMSDKYDVVYPNSSIYIRDGEVFYFITKVNSTLLQEKYPLVYTDQPIIELTLNDE